VPASTTNKTPASIEKAMENAKQRVIDGLKDTEFRDIADLVCKLFVKYMKEDMKL
jgi:hypothetical protein